MCVEQYFTLLICRLYTLAQSTCTVPNVSSLRVIKSSTPKSPVASSSVASFKNPASNFSRMGCFSCLTSSNNSFEPLARPRPIFTERKESSQLKMVSPLNWTLTEQMWCHGCRGWKFGLSLPECIANG